MTTTATSEPIQRRLGAFDTTMIVVSLIIGAGIFRTPSEVALKAGSLSMFYLAWVLGGLIAIAGALTFAEIGVRRPVAGGYYALVSHAYGATAAFMLNWVVLIVSGVNIAIVAIMGVDYLQPLLNEVGLGRGTDPRIIGGLLILGLYAINMAGIRVGARVQNVLSALKVVAILTVAVLGLLWAGQGPTTAPATDPVAARESGFWLALGASLVPVFFTFGGYQMIMNIAGDVRKPQRNLPWGALVGVGLVFTVYMLVNLAYVQVLGFEAVRASKKVAGDLAGALFGPWGDRAFSTMVFLSVLGFLNVAFLHVPRGYLPMARDGLLPPIFGRVHPRRQVQEFGLTFFAVTILIGLVFSGEFGDLLNFVMFIDILAMAILATTLFVLRRRGEGDETAFRAPLYPWLPGLYMAILFGVVLSVLINDVFINREYHTIVAIGILALGYPLSIVCRSAVAAGDDRGAS